MRISQVFGPKSIRRFDTNKGRRWYEDEWLSKANLTRIDLVSMVEDKAAHPQAKFIYLPMEEPTKQRMLNQECGYIICQASTLGWSPKSESCSQCRFIAKCKNETSKKYPEIFRLRLDDTK